MTTTEQQTQTSSDEKVVIVGFGWVGQANALALVQMGYKVYSYDVLPPKQHYSGAEKHLYEKIIQLKGPLEVDGEKTSYMVCVGDRVDEEGRQDIVFIKQALESLRNAKGVVILRSTIVPKSLDDLHFDLYIPEFLHEKFAIQECIRPYYFVLGSGTKGREVALPSYVLLWQERADKVFSGTYTEASFIKYYSNMWNAVRIAFVNELGDVIAKNSTSEHPSEDAERVINFLFEGKSYLRYGKGFGGHCLPKDMRAFLAAYKDEHHTEILSGTYLSNEAHAKFEREHNTSLPEWYSAWNYDSIVDHQKKAVTLFIRKIYHSPPVTFIRHFFKPAVMFGERFVPPRTKEEQRRVWEEKAKENARYYVNQKTRSAEFVDESEIQETGKEDFERLILGDKKLIDRLPGERKKLVVLDIGSGIGRMTEMFAGEFGQVHGIDISPTMVEIARRRLGTLPNVSFKESEGDSVPYGDNTFDLIFSYLVFQHIDDIATLERYMNEIRRTLKPKGVAKIQLRSGLGVRRWVWSYGVPFSQESAARLAEEAGLQVLNNEVEDTKFLWLIVRRP
jgi:protein-L-isoaspartate O-methyltransferase